MSSLFIENRKRLAQKLEGGLVVLAGYTAMQRSGDAAFKFEQEANFWWLTGIEHPDWSFVFDGSRNKSWLIAPEMSQTQELFDGSLAEKEALKVSGVDEIINYHDGLRLLRDLAKKHSMVYSLGEHPYAEHFSFVVNPAQKKLYDFLDRTFNSVQDCRKDLSQLRAIKQPEEIRRIKKAVALTTKAFADVRSRLESYHYEYEVEADFTYLFRKNGAAGHAYDPIVAGGKNACTLHYVDNNAKLKTSELLLLDIGARHHGYAADITRTYAPSEPTPRQALMHEAVSVSHRRIISLLKPNLMVEEYQRKVDEIMQDAIRTLGLIKPGNDAETYRKYFPHAVSHGLGVDVHDSLGAPRYFEEGMVLTVEPGIYIPEEGIGVRIEDDILITKSGHINLSARLSTDL